MLTGVEILLERMKTNPEEFVEGGFSKWSRVLNAGWDIFTEGERTALQNAMNEAKRDHFNGEVMRVLSQGHDDHLIGGYGQLADKYTTNLTNSMAITKTNIASSLLSSDEMKYQVGSILDQQFEKAYAEKDKQTMKRVAKLQGAMKK